MRSIRRAAIAGATAASLILGAASVASADEDNAKNEQGSSSFAGSSGNSEDKDSDMSNTSDKDADDHCTGEMKALSACIGDKLDADEPANGQDLFGSTTDVESQPKWAQLMKAVTVLSLVGSFVGLVAFPAYNFAVANHLLPGMPPR